MTKDELQGANGYKVRLIYGNWWLILFRSLGHDKWKNICQFGPLCWAEVKEAEKEVQSFGLYDIERELGSRGK